MRENRLRTLWANGEAAVLGWLGIPSSVSAENMAQAGWDALNIDMQHGLIDYQTAVQMLQAISTTDTMPMCRVPWNEPGIIGKMLDAGVFGVICPMVNNREQAEALVRACRYPPIGERSFGPVRATWYGGADYFANANDSIVVLAMIETREAVANLDEIMSTPGLDGAYIGPSDLGLSHGFAPKLDREEPELLEIIGQIRAGAERHGKVTGIHCGTPYYARRMIADGFNLVTIAADNALLNNAAKAAVAAVKSDEKATTGSSVY
ncbi:MAG: aldolase/citrate lyase family protein [Pseudomonadota bacterium]